MKRLFIGMVALAAIACKKEAIVNECGIAYQVKDFKTLDGKVTLDSIVTWTSETVECGQKFQDHKTEQQRGMAKPFTPYCPNGETIYYYRLRIVTK